MRTAACAQALQAWCASSRIYSADANNIGLNMELDAILAVALGGNSLGGGKFSLAGFRDRRIYHPGTYNYPVCNACFF